MKNRVLIMFYLIVTLTIITSCETNPSNDLNLITEINKRIEILDKSYKFSIIPINLQSDNYKSLKLQLFDIVKTSSTNVTVKDYENINLLFKKYGISINQYAENKNEILINILIGLDNLIFKYVPSRLNFSNYKTIVVPNKTEIKTGEMLEAKIYLTVSDTLFEPEFQYINNNNIDNLISKNGIGEFKIVTQEKGTKRLHGKAIYSNELGYKDSINWNYEFEIK